MFEILLTIGFFLLWVLYVLSIWWTDYRPLD